MTPSLLLGIIIGMGAVLFCFGVFLAIPARRMSKSGTTFNEKSLAELTERNAIGHDQLAALWKIAGYLAPKDTRAADRKARRERIATAALQGLLASGHFTNQPEGEDGAWMTTHEDPWDDETAEETHPGRCVFDFPEAAVRCADALIAELDKPEP